MYKKVRLPTKNHIEFPKVELIIVKEGKIVSLTPAAAEQYFDKNKRFREYLDLYEELLAGVR